MAMRIRKAQTRTITVAADLESQEDTNPEQQGPLAGVQVIELEGRGPGPYAGMLLSDMGASVLRVSPPEPRHRAMPVGPEHDYMGRGRCSVRIDLKSPTGVEAFLQLVERADVLIEGFRPGVMERLGLGPETCLATKPSLVYGRVTGWGREGSLASTAGHDLTYLAMSGVLSLIGPPDRPPPPPLNLIGDYGSGALFAFGILCALFHSADTSEGQVVDASIVDGSLLQLASIFGKRKAGAWVDQRASNFTDGGAPFYNIYETADGRYVAVGALEPEFYEELLDGLGLSREELPDRMDRSNWPLLQSILAESFRARTRSEWETVFAGSDACVAPVLGIAELEQHPFHEQRGSFIELLGERQPAPTPTMSKTPPKASAPAIHLSPAESLQKWGMSLEESQRLIEADAVFG